MCCWYGKGVRTGVDSRCVQAKQQVDHGFLWVVRIGSILQFLRLDTLGLGAGPELLEPPRLEP